jgi:hypothetical protein
MRAPDRRSGSDGRQKAPADALNAVRAPGAFEHLNDRKCADRADDDGKSDEPRVMVDANAERDFDQKSPRNPHRPDMGPVTLLSLSSR